MAKVNLKIPKGTKCNNGEVCDKDLDIDVDIPEINPTVTRVPEPQITVPEVPQVQQPPPPPQQYYNQNDFGQGQQQILEQDKSYTTEELSDLMPSGVNYAVCKGKNCADSVIKNKKFTNKFKSCPKCGCNNVPYGSNICPCCGKTASEDDEDYWEDSDIELKTDEDEEDDD